MKAKSNRWPAWLASHLGSYKRQVSLALALGLATSVCAALLMFTSGYLISATALAATTLFSVMVPIACVQLFGLGRPLARYAERLASHDWVLRVTSGLRLALYRSIEERIGDPARERAAGEYLGLLSDDVAHLQNLYLRVVFPSVVAYLTALLASALFGFFSVTFALVVLASLVAVTVLMPAASLLATQSSLEQAKRLGAAETARLVDDASGSLDWILAGRAGEAVSSHADADAQVRSLSSSARMRQRACSLASTLLLGVLLCAVIAWSGDAMGGSPATANWIAAFTLGFFPLIETFAVLPAAFAESTTHREAIARLDGYLSKADEPDEAHLSGDNLPEGGHGAPAGRTASPREPSRSDAAASPSGSCGKPSRETPAIALEGVSYTYPSAARPALEGITLSIAGGTATAILGRSGSGKSTLARIICGGLEPDEGTVCVAGEVGYLGQDPYLFNRTLRSNLAIGKPDASDAELAAALEGVGLGDKLASLPHGLDTVIGETGVGFSGGEAHRIALARVLVADSPIVIVDEPFSALDPETEAGLLDTLFTACADKALVVVTHHLAEIERFDRVLFVEGARIDLDGSPAELMETSKRFRVLVDFDRARGGWDQAAR